MKQPIKTVTIDGQEFKLVLRQCQNPRCNGLFFVQSDSIQTICSVKCWEITYSKKWEKDKMPRIYPFNKKLYAKNIQKAKDLKAKIALKLV
jgi:hypothetical protein